MCYRLVDEDLQLDVPRHLQPTELNQHVVADPAIDHDTTTITAAIIITVPRVTVLG